MSHFESAICVLAETHRLRKRKRKREKRKRSSVVRRSESIGFVCVHESYGCCSPRTTTRGPFSAVYSLSPIHFCCLVSLNGYTCACACVFLHTCVNGCPVGGVSAFNSKVKLCELTECILNTIVGTIFIYLTVHKRSPYFFSSWLA